MTDYTENLLRVVGDFLDGYGGHGPSCRDRQRCEDTERLDFKCRQHRLMLAYRAYRSPEAAAQRVELSRAAARGGHADGD